MFFSENFTSNSTSDPKPEEKKFDKLYKTLGVTPEATVSEIRAGYHKLAKQHHPDKGGDEVKFKKINYAYDILIDTEKRQLYDTHGEEGLNGEVDSGGGVNIFDFFNPSSRRPRKGEETVQKLEISLEDIYNQTLKKFKLTKNAICKACKGVGTKSGREAKCDTCDGKGVRVAVKHLGPNMIQQVQMPCRDCKGTGEKIHPKDRCGKCNGAKVVKVIKFVDILIEKGVENNEKIVLREEGDEYPGSIPGDVVFVLKELPHDTFVRKSMNLIKRKSITLSDALCGTTFTIKTLDGRVLKLNTYGTIVSPGEVRCIEDEGMPLHKKPFIKGKLFVKFDVKFPQKNELSDQDLMTISKVLNMPKQILKLPKNYYEVGMSTRSIESVLEEQKAYQEEQKKEEPNCQLH